MKKYVPMPANVFDQPNDQFVLESVHDHLLKMFDRYPSEKDIEERADIPACAKIGWHLWLFAIEVASAGIFDYLVNHCETAEQIIFAHGALKTVCASEMLILLEAAIPLVKADEDFCAGNDYLRHEWFDQFHKNSDWLDLKKISSASFGLAEAPLSALAAKYLRAHRSELQLKSKSRKVSANKPE
jgi:hypothetical protein